MGSSPKRGRPLDSPSLQVPPRCAPTWPAFPCGPRTHVLTWPSPSTTYFTEVSSRRPIGPRACSFWVEMPISAPRPSSLAVDETGRGVHHHCGGVDLSGEPPRRGEVAASRSPRSARAVAGDVRHRRHRGGRRRRRHLQVEELGAKSSSVATPIRRQTPVALVTDELDARRAASAIRGRNSSAIGLVDKEASRRRCTRWALRLGVDDDRARPCRGRRRRRRRRGSCRRRRSRRARSPCSRISGDQAPARRGGRGSRSRPRSRMNWRGRLVARVLDEDDRSPPAGRPWRPRRGGPAATALFESRAPDEPRRKAALPAFRQSAAGVGGDIGPVLVDDADDSERDTRTRLDSQPVRPDVTLDDLTDRIGERRHRAQAGGHGRRRPRSGEGDRRWWHSHRPPPPARRRSCWRRGSRRGHQQLGPLSERLVLLLRPSQGDRPGGRYRAAAKGLERHRASGPQEHGTSYRRAVELPRKACISRSRCQARSAAAVPPESAAD